MSCRGRGEEKRGREEERAREERARGSSWEAITLLVEDGLSEDHLDHEQQTDLRMNGKRE